MRTTISLDEGLLEDLKRRAQQARLSLSAFIVGTLRQALAKGQEPPKARPFKLITFGGDGLRPGVAFERLHEVEEEEDRARLKIPPGPDAAP
jgi:hypothetical protein